MISLNLSFAQAVPVFLADHNQLDIILVGCGGTGSWLAPSVARLVRLLRESGKTVSVYFVDPDIIESVNIPRQNFCDAELGQSKAQVLALRYGMAWGVDIIAIPERFDPDMVQWRYKRLSILVGAVDNAAARSAIASTLQENSHSKLPHVWWLDCGNAKESGQVLLGSALDLDQMEDAFPALSGQNNQTAVPTFCTALPAPTVQHPELLVPLPEEIESSTLSCEQLAMLNAQSLMVNQRVAAEAADFLLRLTLTRDLRRFATYFDLSCGSARSKYTVPETVQAFSFE